MNFTIDELCKSPTALRRGIDNTPDEKIKAELTKLITDVLQPIRDAYGKPIIVSSGYRCPKLNKAVGGATSSQHMKGQAADIHTVSDTVKDNKVLFDLVASMIKSGKIKVGQLINEYNYNWVHVSTPGSHVNQIIAIK